MRRFARVVLGGTFDRLHVGHEALLATAFRAGRSVAIGLTTDGYLAHHPKPGAARIASYRARRATLRRWLVRRYPGRTWTIVPLENPFGRSVEDGVDALVVSADTAAGGRAVNDERWRRGLRTVPLLVVPLVLADDLRPVSSRRVRSGEIDRDGRRRSRIRIDLTVGTPDDAPIVTRGLRAAFPRAEVVRRPLVPPVRARPSRARTRTPSGAPSAELSVVVSGRGRGRRRVGIATPTAVLPPRPVDARSPSRLAAGVANLFARAGRSKRFNHRPR
ncbi:MAG TPA: pantetheine-phosphate adenylyltransferase [Thermoplasmata archaeon]|nr:pantetheine-phosphate adenylyltransferase [Thermoplasmata archaeon]